MFLCLVPFSCYSNNIDDIKVLLSTKNLSIYFIYTVRNKQTFKQHKPISKRIASYRAVINRFSCEFSNIDQHSALIIDYIMQKTSEL